MPALIGSKSDTYLRTKSAAKITASASYYKTIHHLGKQQEETRSRFPTNLRISLRPVRIMPTTVLEINREPTNKLGLTVRAYKGVEEMRTLHSKLTCLGKGTVTTWDHMFL